MKSAMGRLTLVITLLLAASCATGPRLVRPGNQVRVTTTAGDTMVGKMVVAMEDTLVLAREGIGVVVLPPDTIRTLEVDRSTSRRWTRLLACFFAGTSFATTTQKIAEYGWSSDLALDVLAFGSLGWQCVDTRPKWRPGKVEADGDDE